MMPMPTSHDLTPLGPCGTCGAETLHKPKHLSTAVVPPGFAHSPSRTSKTGVVECMSCRQARQKQARRNASPAPEPHVYTPRVTDAGHEAWLSARRRRIAETTRRARVATLRQVAFQ